MAGFTYTMPTITGTHTDAQLVLREWDFPTGLINGGGSSLPNGGGSLIAYTDNTKTTRIPMYVARFVTGGTPDIEVWVKRDAATGNTIYFDDDPVQVSQPAVTDTYGRNAVFSTNKVTYDFSDDPSGGTLTDLCGDTNATTSGTFASGDLVDSKIGKGWSFDGTNYAIATGVNASPSTNLDNQARTTSIWIKLAATTSPRGLISIANANATTGVPIVLAYLNGGHVDLLDGEGATRIITSPSTASFYKIDLVYDDVADISYGYVNGAEATSYSNLDGINTATNVVNLYIASGFSGQPVCEVCYVSHAYEVRSADRLALDYANQNSSSGAVWGTVGAIEGAGASVTDINTDEVIDDGEVGVTFTTSGFSGEITSVSLTDGTYATAGTSISSTSGAGTFDVPDVTGYTSDTVGAPFTQDRNSADGTPVATSHTVNASLSDGTDTAALAITLQPKVGWRVSEQTSAVKTSGSIWVNWIGTIVDGTLAYFNQGTGDGQLIGVTSTGIWTSNSTTDVDIQVWDASDGTYKQMTILIASGGGASTNKMVKSQLRGQIRSQIRAQSR